MHTQPIQNPKFPSSLSPVPDQADRWLSSEEPISFDAAAELISSTAAADGERNDFDAIDLRAWAFGSMDGETMALTRIPFRGQPGRPPLVIRERAFQQLCHRIGAPASYVRDLPAKLQVACMNYGLTTESRPALLRSAGSDLRAVLSDRYAALDDPDLIDIVGTQLKRMGYQDDVMVRSISTGTTTVMRLTVPVDGVPVRKGDIIEYGLDIANSELGLRSVQVTPITYRLVCTNGMRAWQSDASFRTRHVGDTKRIRNMLKDALPIAFAEARGDLKRWKRATEQMVDSALDEIATLRGFGLPLAETKLIEAELLHEVQLSSDVSRVGQARYTSVFDVANAITATAKRKGATPARLALEEVGHRYLTSRVA